MTHFSDRLAAHGRTLRRTKTEVLQINVGKLCNLVCVHCHVNAGPKRKVEIIGSMPCYTPENVNAQRGEGVFDGSIKALQLLNSLGYGLDADLPLHLVYNPVGAFLPGSQAELKADYKRELQKYFGI